MEYWFYSLSTIAQVLAALVAVSATAVIFKLNALNKRIRSVLEQLAVIATRGGDELLMTRDDKEILNFVNEQAEIHDYVDKATALPRQLYEDLVKKRKKIVSAFTFVFFFQLGILVTSLLLLPNNDVDFLSDRGGAIANTMTIATIISILFSGTIVPLLIED